MSDSTEAIRREMVAQMKANGPVPRHALETVFGKVWDTEQLRAEFNVTGFMAPFVGVRRKSDNQIGTMTFQHHPRLYWGFAADKGDA